MAWELAMGSELVPGGSHFTFSTRGCCRITASEFAAQESALVNEGPLRLGTGPRTAEGKG